DPIVLSNARQAKLSDKIELPRVVSDFQTNFFTEQKSSGAAQEYRYDASLNKGEITDPFQAAVHDAAEIDPLIKDAKIYKMTAPVATIKQGFDRAITAEYGEGTVRRDMANILVRNEVPAAFAMPVMEDGQKVIVVYEQAARNRYGLHDNPVVAALEHEALAHTGLSDREVIATQQSRRTIPVQSVTPTQITAQIVQDTYSQPTGFEVIDTAQLRDLSPIEMVRPSMKIASQSTFNPTSPTMATQVAPQQQFRPQMDMAPMRAASSPVDMTGPVVTPKDTVQGRNRDVNTIMTSPLFSEVTGIDLRTGNHKVVDIGVGSVPVTTGEMAKALRSVNRGIRVIGTELPSAAPKAYITSPKMVERFRSEAASSMPEMVKADSVNDIKLVVNSNNQVTEALVGFTMDDGRQGYKTLAVAPSVQYKGSTGVTSDEKYRRTELFTKIASSIGEAKMTKLIQGGRDVTRGDVRIEFNPLKKSLRRQGASFKATDNVADTGVRNVSVMTVNNVTLHMNAAEKTSFLNDQGRALKDQGVIIVKNRVQGKIGGYNQIEFYQKLNGAVRPLAGETNMMNTRLDGSIDPAHVFDGPFGDAMAQRHAIANEVVNSFSRDQVARLSKVPGISDKVASLQGSIDISNQGFRTELTNMLNREISGVAASPVMQVRQQAAARPPINVAEVINITADTDPLVYETFLDDRLFNALSSGTGHSKEKLTKLFDNTNKFAALVSRERHKAASGDMSGLFGPEMSPSETRHSDGRVREQQSGNKINIDYLKQAGIDPSNVLVYRATQPSTVGSTKPEYYWTTDYSETQTGLGNEISADQRRSAVTLVSDLETINRNGGLIQDINDDQGVSFRQIGTSNFDQNLAIARIPSGSSLIRGVEISQATSPRSPPTADNLSASISKAPPMGTIRLQTQATTPAIAAPIIPTTRSPVYMPTMVPPMVSSPILLLGSNAQTKTQNRDMAMMADTRPAVGEITQTTAHFANRGDSNIHVPELNLSFRPGDQVSYSRQDTIAIPRADGKVDAILVQGNTVTAPVMINNNGREVQIQAGDTVVKYENDTFAVRDRFTGEIKIALKGGTSMPAMPSTKTVKVNDQIFSNFEKSDVFDMSGAAPRSTAIQLDNASWGARLFVSSSDIGAKTDNA
ncbi:MAG: hypothetical protein KAR32_01440, partial [Candidatus Omnitrophica bacterium]|nr:hypothetical protein [Candidatus Omnitrophota bacterium]